jgi:hypothetical protein
MVIDLNEVRRLGCVDSWWEMNRGGEHEDGIDFTLKGNASIRPFPWKLHIPDICDIRNSTLTQNNASTRRSNLYTSAELGGTPSQRYRVNYPSCNKHWTITFGLFLPVKGWLQGSVETNERLVAYASLRRFGEILLYSQFTSHADYLSKGSLVLMHHAIIEWIIEHRQTYTHGLRYVMYGGAQNGGQSLYQWKCHSGFKPLQLVVFTTRNRMNDWLEVTFTNVAPNAVLE